MMTSDPTSVPAQTLQAIKAMTQAEAVAELKTVLRAAIKLEMATIPIYLYTYYSVCRKPGRKDPATEPTQPVPPSEAFPLAGSLYGNQAGAVIMSVAVEEMLHMSLAMNLLTSMLDAGETLPQIYDGLTFGNTGGIVLPALSTLTPQTGRTPGGLPVETITGNALEIPLAKLSLEQLHHFMRIEYPGKKDSVSVVVDPLAPDWATIGEVYDYAKALIQFGNSGASMDDAVFQKTGATQIGSDNYSASSIDTLSSGNKWFTFDNPPVVGTDAPPAQVAVSTVAQFENDDNHDHEGDDALFRIASANDAISAINTICEQGEGADFTDFVERDDLEESHYYKFWSLCAQLDGYPAQMQTPPQVAGLPAPATIAPQIIDLGARFVYDFPTNPKASDYHTAARSVVDVANGLFQYMLIMSETTLLVPTAQQKLYFNKTMHQSMIWVMDKFYQDLRHVQDRGRAIVPTFENPFPTGTTRENAFAQLQALVVTCKAKANTLHGYKAFGWNLDDIAALPDVSPFWRGDTGVVPSPLPAFLIVPDVPAVTPDENNAGPALPETPIGAAHPTYQGTQKFPATPPEDAQLDHAAGAGNWVRHACMGLNSCKNQGRTLNNDCAGQGWCATSLGYNPSNPAAPLVSDHTCHVKNDCQGQGGCGLYGTQDELNVPGGNACQTTGSCATPINAERFITEGDNRKKSVWKQARAHFNGAVWPTLPASGGGTVPPPADGQNYPADTALFAHGPTIEWIANASGEGMTACGSSGMSGAGSCA
ncbi:ferritin-like protein [Rhodobacteraceae bacterium N5(2021)]|uniref:Ferritin-like protein n=1 Tax=Gymnodinialimonas phycosphaerae TaxID=2841589 RepID=A0A975YFX7_9RHOB|nr:ferritin-like protein [Gymnodinialimonas phycosphaerae]MBY4895284.1 ferritin-like protein [Gymnodinialimonas phycosphaerae]